jgi:hypothetical protein
MKPKKLSKRELMRESKSEKNGITSAMMKANTQVTARMAAQVAQPTAVLLVMWRLPWKMRKNKNLELIDAYRTPRKIKVGIMKLKLTLR